MPRTIAASAPRERLADLLHWRRIPGGLRYLRRFGLRGLLRRLFPQLRTYRAWVDNYDTLSAPDVAAIREQIATLSCRPLVSLLLPVGDADVPRLRRAIAGVAAQLYPEWELCIGAAPAAARTVSEIVARRAAGARIRVAPAVPESGLAGRLNAALAVASGALVTVMRAEDELAPHALYMLAVEAGRHPGAQLLYSDEDAIGPAGRRSGPRFKPDWDPDLLLGDDFVGRLAAYRRDLVAALGGFRAGFAGAEEHDLALRAAEQVTPQHIRHIPMVLYHRRGPPAPAAQHAPATAAAASAHCRAVGEHLVRMGVAATVSPLPGDRVRVHHALPIPPPGVSLIVPTRDNLDVLQRCVGGLLDRTDYDPRELIIVDNDSRRAETLAYLAAVALRPSVRVLRFDGPFNYSAVNNFAVAQARYGIVGLINDDVEVIHPDWLREMVSHAARPQVGAVGAKLYYPNDTIQHAGTIVGLGGAAGHAFRHFPRGDPGYCTRLLLTQNLSAVTAACMILRREVFEEVGGLDAVNLAIAFNDVDLCLRIREKGYRIVWTPFAELYHWESVSRGSDLAPDKIERFRREAKYLGERWRTVVARDPYYSPNLTVEGENFDLAFPPRVTPPWAPPDRRANVAGC